MLTSLTVENYALIDRLNVCFDSHLNIITGETGAGKSVLMGALSLLLGAKCDTEAIRDTSRSCIIEGEFDISKLDLRSVFEAEDMEYDDTTVIRRMILPSGKSRAFVNDSPVTLASLKTLGQYLVDIHSQHQNLILSSESFRMRAIDTIANNEQLLSEYRQSFETLGRLRVQLRDARQSMEQRKSDEQWLRHQAEELVSVSLREGECVELEDELRMLENADRIVESLSTVHGMCDADETGILSQLSSCQSAMRRIKDDYKLAAELAERIHSVLIEIRDIDATVADGVEHIESDSERLEKVSARLDTIYSLCQKHRVVGEQELIAKRDEYVAKVSQIEHDDEDIARLEQELAIAEERCKDLAQRLHDSRSAVVGQFSDDVCAVLHKVGMVDARFEIELCERELSLSGKDEVNFLFSANKGVEARSIERIASGGELSRVMLALKAILARRLALPTIIFDEIDAGVSGRVANAMGDIIAELASQMQVVDITHLPQVASKGNRHFLVFKENSSTMLRELSSDERVEEIAKMLSGDKVTSAAIEQARILLGR